MQLHEASRIGARPRGTTEDEKGDTLDLMEENLKQLMVLVPYTREEDIPIHMCRHPRGGGGCFSHLLHKLAWDVLCYSENHHDDQSSYAWSFCFMYIYGIRSGSDDLGPFLSYQFFMRYFLKHLYIYIYFDFLQWLYK